MGLCGWDSVWEWGSGSAGLWGMEGLLQGDEKRARSCYLLYCISYISYAEVHTRLHESAAVEIGVRGIRGGCSVV
jgi:hypothetical protein